MRGDGNCYYRAFGYSLILCALRGRFEASGAATAAASAAGASAAEERWGESARLRSTLCTAMASVGECYEQSSPQAEAHAALMPYFERLRDGAPWDASLAADVARKAAAQEDAPGGCGGSEPLDEGVVEREAVLQSLLRQEHPSIDLALVRALRRLAAWRLEKCAGSPTSDNDGGAGDGASLTFEELVVAQGSASMAAFVSDVVLTMGVEAEGVVLQALPEALGVRSRIVYLDRSAGTAYQCFNYPDGRQGSERGNGAEGDDDATAKAETAAALCHVHLMLKPGHYDVLLEGKGDTVPLDAMEAEAAGGLTGTPMGGRRQRQQQRQQQQRVQAAAASTTVSAATAPQPQANLLPGWTEHFDHVSRLPYWHHVNTQRSVWQPPLVGTVTHAPAPAPAPATLPASGGGAAAASAAVAASDSAVQAVILKLGEMGTPCDAGQAASALLPHRAGAEATMRVERAVQWLMEEGFGVLEREQRRQQVAESVAAADPTAGASAVVDTSIAAHTSRVDASASETAARALAGASAGGGGVAKQVAPYFPLRLFLTQRNLLKNPLFDRKPAYCAFKKCTPELWNNEGFAGGQAGIGSVMAEPAFQPLMVAEPNLVADASADPHSTAGNHFLIMKGVTSLWQEILVTPGKEYMFAAVVAQGGDNSVPNSFRVCYVEVQPNRDASGRYELLHVRKQDMPMGWGMRAQAVPIVFTESTVQIIIQTSEPAPPGGRQYECATVVERVGLFELEGSPHR